MNQSRALPNAVQALTALTVLFGAFLCPAAVINFDNLSGPVALDTQYASQGVMFNQIEATSQFATSAVTVSPANYATPFYSNTNTGMLWFVDPTNSNIQAYVNSVTITLNGYNNAGGWFDGAIIEALDPSNAVIQSETINPTTGTNYGSMSITFTGPIHELDFINILNANGNLGIFPFDDLTFGTPTDTPEPSTWWLVGSVMAGALARMAAFHPRLRTRRL